MSAVSRRSARVVVTGSVSALIAGLLYGSVAPAASADEQMAPAAGEVAGIETVGPIATVASSSGERWPTLPTGVAVMPRGTVVNGDFPLVHVPALSSVDSADYRVRELSSQRPDANIVNEGTLANGWATLGARLAPGGEFAVDAKAEGSDWTTMGTFSVAAIGSAVGPTVNVGGMAVSQVTGEASWGWRSPNLPGPAGGVHAGLSWVSGSPASPGLPEGWRLTAETGSAWAQLEEVGRNVEAIDVPTAYVAKRPSPRARVTVDFAYPAPEARLADGFVVQARVPSRSWKSIARPGTSFARHNVDVRATAPAKARHVRVGVRTNGTIVWGRPVRITAAPRPVTAAPLNRHLRSAGPGSIVTAGELPSVVRLVSWNGSPLTFVRNTLGVYEQVGGGAPGFANVLTWIKDGEWEFADTQGVVTRFVDGRAVSVIVQDLPAATMTWDSSGRLTRLTNEAGRSMEFGYDACPAWSGFATAPAGMLCTITYPGGARTEIGYVTAGNDTQIALVKDAGNVGTALGWDDRGRLVSTRSTLVSQVATIESGAAAVLNTLDYGSDGRVARVNAAPATLGGAVVGQTLDYPFVNEAVLRAYVQSGSSTDAVVAQSAFVGTDYRISESITLDPVTWQTLSSTNGSGLRVRLNADSDGMATSMVDALGRSTRYEYNELGLVTRTVGPFDGSGGPTTSLSYDTTRVNGSDRPLNGLRVQVYSRDAYAGTVEPEFWKGDFSRGGLSASWSDRGTQFSAQAAAVWTPDEASDRAGSRGGWRFGVSAATGSDVSFIVGGVVCETSSEPCVVRGLPTGPKAVAVQVRDAGSSGWFAIDAAPVGQRLAPIPSDQIGPGYALTTVATANDSVGGSANARTDYAYARPEFGQPSSITSAGDLVTSLAYEQSNAAADAWGRLVTRTTPGGKTQTTSYWPATGTASLPALCGGDSVEVSGQPRTVTRQDGTSVTGYYDIDGNIRASEVTGDGQKHTYCTSYFPSGMVRSTESYDNAGTLVERIETRLAVGGDPRVTAIVVTHGDGSAWSKGAVREATSTSDLAGRSISSTDFAGSVTTTQFDALGNVTSRTVTPPAGAGAAPLTATYTYDSATGVTRTVRINGTLAASIDVNSSTGDVSSITYADGVQTSLGYYGNGQVNRINVTTPDPRFTRLLSSVEQSAYGRIESKSLRVTGTDAITVDHGYTYDAARRLSRVAIDGATPERVVYEYSYGAQASTCPSGYSAAGRDGLRTGGSRSGTDYVQCHDARGRTVATTDPLVTGGSGTADIEHDAFGRVTRITGPRALAVEWSTGTQATEVHEIASDGAGLVSTRFDYFGNRLLDRTLVTDAGATTTRMSGPFQLRTTDGEVTGTEAIQYGLPGGATVTTAPGATATLTLPGIDRAALVTVEVPSLGFGLSTAPGTAIGLAQHFGPYGEPLVAPDVATPSPVPTYSWMAGAGMETLPGTASITMMGSRPYHPMLGEFLAPDPGLDSGDNLYSYTNGDPVNTHDISGNDTSEPLVIGATSGVAGFLSALLGGFLKGRGWGKLGTTLQVLGSVGAGAGTYLAMRSQSASAGVSILSGVLAALGTGAASYGMSKWSAKRTAAAAAARDARSKVVLHVDPEPVHAPGWADYLFSEAKTEQEVLKMYKSRAMKYHPDKGGTDALFQEFGAAMQRRKDIINGVYKPPPAPPQNPARQNFQPPAQQKPAYNPRDSLDSDDMDDYTAFMRDYLKNMQKNRGFD